MFVEVDGLKVYYDVTGSGKSVILLHGWGGQAASFKPLFDYLAQSFKVYAPDLPGFGQSSLPPVPWGVNEYTHFINGFFKKLEIARSYVIAHSFGGRVGLMLAANFPERVEKLVLIDSAGIRPKRTIKYYLRIGLAKMVKRVFFTRFFGEKVKDALFTLMGSEDYRKAGKMRGTLVKVVNEDLKYLLPKVKAPTLIVWGEKDKVVPVWHAKIMEREIEGAILVILKDAGHFSYLDNFPQFCGVVSNFLEGS